MTNKERQSRLDKKKWFTSKMYKRDCSGSMPYCISCTQRTCTHICKATQAERENQCLCAKAYNKMSRVKKEGD